MCSIVGVSKPWASMRSGLIHDKGVFCGDSWIRNPVGANIISCFLYRTNLHLICRFVLIYRSLHSLSILLFPNFMPEHNIHDRQKDVILYDKFLLFTGYDVQLI